MTINEMRGRKRQRLFQSIRDSFAAFGCPIDNVSDEEMEQSMLNIAHGLAQSGVTMRDATEAFKEVALLCGRISI